MENVNYVPGALRAVSLTVIKKRNQKQKLCSQQNFGHDQQNSWKFWTGYLISPHWRQFSCLWLFSTELSALLFFFFTYKSQTLRNCNSKAWDHFYKKSYFNQQGRIKTTLKAFRNTKQPMFLSNKSAFKKICFESHIFNNILKYIFIYNHHYKYFILLLSK